MLCGDLGSNLTLVQPSKQLWLCLSKIPTTFTSGCICTAKRLKVEVRFSSTLLYASLFDDEFLSLDRVDEKRFETASKVVQEINSLARQRPGDYFTSIKVPSDLSGSQCQCYLCVLGNVCLGPSCLGYSGKVENQVA